MADVKTSALPAAAPLTKAELLAVVQSGSSVQTTIQAILDEVPVSAPVPDSVAVDVPTLVDDYNSLLAALKSAGMME